MSEDDDSAPEPGTCKPIDELQKKKPELIPSKMHTTKSTTGINLSNFHSGHKFSIQRSFLM
jgi:hypothetical protein